ncbi:hypothetical protein D3C80_1205050 [compost metagenome]
MSTRIFPALPALVVTITTPLAATDPYIAAAAPSLSTSMLSISLGLTLLIVPGKPSMIYSGSLLPKVLTPRILTCTPAPAIPLFFCTLTPAATPCNASAGFVVARFARSFVLILAIAPVTSDFFKVPYPITTTSSSSLFPLFKVISTSFPACTLICWFWYPT